MKVGKNRANNGMKKTSSINSHSNAGPGSSKNSQNGDLMNSISVLTAERLTQWQNDHSDKQNRDKSVSLGDRESYYEGFDTTNLQKVGKEKSSRSPFRRLVCNDEN